ncbi:MAG: malectin domain-containing carbohydrate-binding protein, partial [Cyanobacteria bacterium P01_D01_bin.1]
VEAEDPEGLSTSATFAVTVSDPSANTAPTTTGIADITVTEGADNTVISLFNAFEDVQDTDTELTYSVTGNTFPELFDGININPITGELTLNYEATGVGVSEITIEAEDTSGAVASTSFVVNVVSPNAADGTIRINAGGGDIYDPDGNLWQSDMFFSGGQLFSALGRPITNADDNFRFDELYQTQRLGGDFSYAIPVTNGSYRINLHLSELTFDTNDKRLFDVSIEDEVVFENLDIFAKTKNAFLDGKDTSRVLQLEEELAPPGDIISIEDGTFNLDFTASLQSAAIAGIEIIQITTPEVVIKPSNNGTNVSEGGQTDTYDVVLTTEPTSDVTIDITVNGQLSTNKTSVTFDSTNWFNPQTVTIEAVDDTQAEGIHTASISHSITTSDPLYQTLTIPEIEATIADNDQVSPISFTVKSIPTINLPTRAAWGPDGRLYVTSLRGKIAAYEFDGDYNIVSSQTIDTIEPLENHEILGIAFNPFDTEPKIYVAHSHLEANGGKPFPVTEFSPYSGQVSILEGPNFETLTPLITGLPVSNHDHGINGLEFDNDGNLYIAVGGNTNAGIVSEAIGGIDEASFTAAVLKAEITKPDFNGNVEYTLPAGFVDDYLQANNLTLSDFVREDGTQFDLADSQVFGYAANVVPGVDVSVYTSGNRNPFDLVQTTQGKLYSTDNGANFNAGESSTGANTQAPLGGKQFDELNLLVEGAYYGSPNRNRGRTDARQNVFYGTNNPYSQSIPGVFTEPIGIFGKNSTNGIDEYRANTFGGQLKGNLIAHEYNGDVWSVDLSADGTAVDSIVDLNDINGSKVAEGLDVVTGMGGAIIGVDIQGDLLTVAVPNDPNATTPTAYDVFPWRAPAVGGSNFIIGGVNFDTSDTQVFIGTQEVVGLGITDNRISGIIPDLTAQSTQLLDVKVVSGGIESIIPEAFQSLA